MDWQTIDFQGIADLESSLIPQLRSYLEKKEGQLAQLIANSIPTDPGAEPNLPTPFSRTRLLEGVEIFTRRAHQELASGQPVLPGSEWQNVSNTINKAIWEYVEILEGSAVELFQQLDQVGFEHWRLELIQVVETIKDLLMHSLEDLKWALKRLESQLQSYRARFKEGISIFLKIGRKLFRRNTILDRSIISNIERSQKFLNFSFQNFTHRYKEFQELDDKISKIMSKFSSYELLDSIDSDEKVKFKQLYRFLKLWEQNQSAQVLPELELIRGVNRSINPEKAFQVFKDYYRAIKNLIFNASRNLKNVSEGEQAISREELLSSLVHGRMELHTLGATISKYREFLLKSDPDPYVRSRGGFSEWIIGLEPPTVKPLMDQEYDLESLDAIFLKFENSLRNEPVESSKLETLNKEIWEILHDMGQPFASRQMMQVRSNHFVTQLKEMDELASTDPSIVDKVTELLSRALRADWKYIVLYDIPLFHEIYAVHQGILGPDSDRAHLARLGEFKLLTDRLCNWVKEKKLFRHRHEVELDINDIKGSLQDMLAHVQRTAKDPAIFNNENGPRVIQEISRQLLEYRYLFHHFFHRLRGIETDEKLLRNQFLFVDHYFESVENKLIEMRSAIS